MQGSRSRTASASAERDRALICVVGSLNVDLVSYASRIPNAGETLSSESFTTGWGGKGANQAVATARLASSSTARPASSSTASDVEEDSTGIRVKMIGAVGADSFGPDLKAAMEGQGVDTSDVRVVTSQPTGVAVILVETSSGENRILVNAGANATVLPPTLPQSLFDNISGSPPSLIIMQLETPLETVLHVCREAKKRSIPVLLNPAPAIPLPDSVYPDLELLVVNETEASILSGIALPANSDKETVVNFAYAAGKWFNTHGCPQVIVTLGALGAVVSTDYRISYHSAVPTEVVDTTAAGDTFIGAVAVSLARRRRWTTGGVNSTGTRGFAFDEFLELQHAVWYAVRASAWTVARKGTWDAMPTADDIPAGRQ